MFIFYSPIGLWVFRVHLGQILIFFPQLGVLETFLKLSLLVLISSLPHLGLYGTHQYHSETCDNILRFGNAEFIETPY